MNNGWKFNSSSNIGFTIHNTLQLIFKLAESRSSRLARSHVLQCYYVLENHVKINLASTWNVGMNVYRCFNTRLALKLLCHCECVNAMNGEGG